MPSIRPFVGLLYEPSVAGSFERVTAPPYDAILPGDRERYHAASPYNVVRLILGPDRPGDTPTENRYTRAAGDLVRWRREGVLVPTAGPALFPYEFRFVHAGAERTLRGVIAEVRLEPLGGSIVPHERTLPGPIEDRMAVLRAVRANLSPVYAVYRGPAHGLSSLLDAVAETAPARETVDEAGTSHRLWVVRDRVEDGVEALREESLMIADGHHRYAVALAHQQQMAATEGPGPWDWLMMLLVDTSIEQPPVLPIHRVLMGAAQPEDPPGRPPDRPVRDLAEVLAALRDEDLMYGVVRRTEDLIVHAVGSLQGTPPTVRALHEQVLFGTPPGRIRFVPDAALAEEMVVSGLAGTAYLLPPTRVERIRDVLRMGGRLPEKSTYFWPKPRTGMVIRPFDR